VNKIIFGGTFDPVHNGHLYIAKAVLEYTDRVVFVPCYENPFAKNIKASPEDRIKMLEIALKDQKRFEISDYEIVNEGISYTIDTVKHFIKEGVSDLGILIGYDVLVDLDKWKDIEELLDLVTFYVFNRPDTPVDIVKRELNSNLLRKANIVHLDHRGMNVSSTMVKIYRYMNEDLTQFLPKDVVNYIDESQLYLKEKTFSDIPEDTMLCNSQINGRMILRKNQ